MSLVLEYGGGSPPPATADILYAADPACLSSQSSNDEEDSCPIYHQHHTDHQQTFTSRDHQTIDSLPGYSSSSPPVRRSSVLSVPLTDSALLNQRFKSSPALNATEPSSSTSSRMLMMNCHFDKDSPIPQNFTGELADFNDSSSSSLFLTADDHDSRHHSDDLNNRMDDYFPNPEASTKFHCNDSSTSTGRRHSGAGHVARHSSFVSTDDGCDPSSSGVRMAGKAIRRRKRSPPSVTRFDINDNSLHSVYTFIRSFLSASTASTVAIDNKIEQAMDLVKSHLMFAVREEVDVLKEKIGELMERINHLECENTVLRKYATQDTLQQLQHTAPNNP